MKTAKEIRSSVSLRSIDGKPKVIGGYIAKWDEPSLILCENGRRFVEVIRKGAFTKTIAEDDIHCLWNHGYGSVLGRNTSGTLRLKEDDIGLYFENDPPDNSIGNDVWVMVKREDVTGCSFGGIPTKENWIPQGDSTYMHEVLEWKLLEVTITPIPAYPSTEVSARSLDKFIDSLKEAEKPIMREHAKRFFELF